MRKHFVWVLLITLFSFSACNKRDSVGHQMRDDNTSISLAVVKIATLNDDGKIESNYSEAKVIQRFNEKNPGFSLESIAIEDLDKKTLDSKITLFLSAYDSVKKEQHTFEINTVMKVADEYNKIGYYIHSSKDADIFEE